MILPLRFVSSGFLGVLALLLALWGLPLPGQAQLPATPAPPARTLMAGRLVFKLKSAPGVQRPASAPAASPALEAALRQLGAQRVEQKFPRTLAPGSDQPEAVDLRLVYQVELASPTQSVLAACQALRKTGAVEYAEPLYSYAPLYQPNDPMADSLRPDNQYYLKNIQAYRAWDVTRGDTSLTIAIVDGGTRIAHEDLGSQIQVNRLDPIDGVDNDKDGYVDNYYGWDFADRDNDPSREPGSVHGILVAGCAAAAPDNGKGIAGVGFRCRFMPLKIYPSTPNGTFGGYEAIVYAADHGCQVINLSWGGVGGRSRFEQDVITYAAINRNAVVVAAAGNTGAELDFYPASYDYVLSVAMLSPNDERHPFATYSRRVDVSAPGIQVLTTRGDTNSDYVAVGGSSFSSPIVAGAAALVRHRFPQYTAAQVIAQLRRTTDNIDVLPGNTPYAGFIGTGRLNLLRAVTERQHSARVVARTWGPFRHAYAPLDTIRLTTRVQNLLAPVSNLVVTLTSLSPHLTVRQGLFAAGPLVTLEQRANTAAPFRLAVAATVPPNTRAVLRYRFQDAATGYLEDQYETLVLNPDYAVMDANDLLLTLTSRGNLGYDGVGSEFGEGVSYRGGAPLLAEGSLLLGTATRLSNNARGLQGADQSFFALARAARLAHPLRADQEARVLLRDSLPTLTKGRSVGVRVRQRALAWAAAPHRDYVILEYHLTNLTRDTLKPLHLGLFMDWDLPGDANRNVAAWDSVRRVGYLFDPVTRELYAGVQHLTGGRPLVYSIDNKAPLNAAVRLADGFSPAEKLLTLNGGTRTPSAGGLLGSDVSQVVGATLAYLAPADSAVVTFAVLAASSLPQLQAAATAAATRYQQALPARTAQTLLDVQVFPNPTTGLVQLTLPPGPASVRVLSGLGQLVQARTVGGGSATLDLRACPAGLYLVQVRTAAGSITTRRVIKTQ